jgi:hypothetical protein
MFEQFSVSFQLNSIIDSYFCYSINRKKMRAKYFIYILGIIALVGCKKDNETGETPTPEGPRLIFRFAFDSSQERLDNLGNPSTVPAGHGAQNPSFNKISAHYLELTPTMFTALGAGEVLYKAPETEEGGDNAIDFDQSIVVSEGEDFFSIPVSQMTPGTYEYLRVSLAYQNYDIAFLAQGFDLTGTLASFIGFNTFIENYVINTQSIPVNDDKLQGYWGFETDVPFLGVQTFTGQAPPGATTVPNPLFSSSPIPAGSCVVTGEFAEPLTIQGNETEDIIINISLSTNQSFEWVEINEDGKFEPEIGETVVDMGIRGLIPYVIIGE